MIKAFGTCTLLKINPCGQEENLPGAWEEALVSARAKPAPACPQTPAGGDVAAWRGAPRAPRPHFTLGLEAGAPGERGPLQKSHFPPETSC